MAKVSLIHGFVGAGKTTFAKKLAEETGAIRFSPDEWMEILYSKNPPQDKFAEYDQRIKMLIWKIAESLLHQNQDVILDFGFWSRAGRDKYRQKAHEIKADTVLYSLTCDVEVMRARVKKRTKDAPEGALFVDDHAFDLFWPMFEPVQEDEPHISIQTC